MENYPNWAKDCSEQNIDDQKLKEIIPSLKGIRWLDLRFNKIELPGLELLSQSNLPELEVVALFGNPCGSPGEDYNIDFATGDILPKSIKSTKLTEYLENKFGYRKWFHPISEFGDPFPLPSRLLSFEPIFNEDYEEELD